MIAKKKSIEDFFISTFLGRGSYASVFMAMNIISCKYYALKIMKFIKNIFISLNN